MPRSLTERQRRFVEAHLVTRNAKQAALEAGHDPEWAPAASVSPDETDFAANGIMGADFLVPTVRSSRSARAIACSSKFLSQPKTESPAAAGLSFSRSSRRQIKRDGSRDRLAMAQAAP